MNRDEQTLAGLHETFLTPPQPKYVGLCDAPSCSNPIYQGDAVMTTGDGDMTHEDCWDEFAKHRLEAELGYAE